MSGALAGKAVVITGAARGIGAACARHAAGEGGAVILNDVDAAAAESVAASIREAGGRAVAHAADITRWAEADGLMARCMTEFGAIDGLVNNAGLYRLADLAESDEAHIRGMVEVNLIGAAFCATLAARRMRRGGSIVNMTSGGQTGLRGGGIYGATKGAIASATFGWATEFATTGLRVNSVSPVAQTRMSDETDGFRNSKGLPSYRSGPRPGPEVNAPAVTWLLSDRAAAVNGQVLWILGTRLSLMTHPAVLSPPLEAPEWTVEAIDAAFRTTLAARQLPLGIAGLEATVVDLDAVLARAGR